ncbi:hypothetical protein NODU109028_17295 [Nocardioides dubius]|uniref:Uncharacterized protein n=1 Tax=Nocardioides dubius TaxID=317019 RepID=A0ABN1TTC4_9ACTN
MVGLSLPRGSQTAAPFCDSAITPCPKTDAYFNGEAQTLIGLLPAAAELPITTVHDWLTRPTSTVAVDIFVGTRPYACCPAASSVAAVASVVGVFAACSAACAVARQ